jgi:phage-related protein
MANTIMSLAVALGLDSGDFDKGLNTSESKAHKIAGSIGKGLGAIGGMAMAGATAAVGAGIALISSSIGPASDLNETVSKIGVVFGDMGPEMVKFGQDAAASMGMSANAALSAAGTYGNLFRSMGITTDTSYDMSTGLVQLAADLASFNNFDPTEVLDSLRAGLTGETEPLRKLGVLITQATLEQKAFEMGLYSGTGAIDAAAKAQASYAMIMEQTTLAQGDAANTIGLFAGQQRVLGATFENLKASIGTSFLPVLAGAMNSISGYTESISGVLDSIEMTMDQKMGAIGDIVKGAASDIVGALPGMATKAVTIISSVVSGIVSALPALIPAIVGIISSLGEMIISVAPAILEGMIQLFFQLIGSLMGILPQFLEVGLKMLISLVTGIAQALPTLIPQVIQVLVDLIQIFIENIPLLIEAGIQLLMGLLTGLLSAIPILVSAIPKIITSLITALTTALPMLIDALLTAIPMIVQAIPEIITSLVEVLVTSIPLLIDAGIQMILGLIQGLLSVIPVLIEAIPAIIDALIDALVYALPLLVVVGMEAIPKLIQGIMEALPQLILMAVQIVMAVVNTLVENWPAIRDAGINLVTALWEGIQEMWKSLKKGFMDMVQGLIDGVKKLLKIRSPSQIFLGIGEDVALGLNKGFADNLVPFEASIDADLPNVLPSGWNQIPSGSVITELLQVQLGDLAKGPTAREIGKAVVNALMTAGAIG